ncbi:isoleucine--tRNA ligase [Psittacicella gerlachiana]|uniref:Isoleucine--tRNA ligase n=1 Tax=Psittacicella gerlachiana TaxID=2028574 RepID=A0A3A1YCT0_9GAMM|nr:isoleucine--tRNA ligase [Psittacicella gerlachiana]RIY34024.1 isoleucine--tRNA ligase [Psittacicella gerlachiana]
MSENNYNLNLPQTDFPMRGELPKREPQMLEQWYKDELYQQIRKARENRPMYILHDGPPYANGTIHLGHALNKILKDIIIKAKTIEGYDSPYIPGWDCHGLPIELKVEGLVGKPGVNVDAKEFRQKCREYALEQVDLQRADFKRLGVLGDWENPYLTMNFDTEAEIIRTLGNLVKNGHMFKGHKPVYWCVECASALAEAEVEYRDKKSESIYVAFAAKDAKAVNEKFGVTDTNAPTFAMIWTTTPWTIPGNRAISLNAEFEYVLVKATVDGNQYFAEPAYFVLAKELVETVATACKFSSYEVVGHPVLGKDLELLTFVHPLFSHDVPFILGDHVGLDAGTGLVHTAPDNGLEDFEVCKKYGIGLANIINDDSEFKADVPKFAGMKIFDANVPVIKELAYAGRLVFKTSIQHSYPHCWRHKTPVVYRATPQWFIGMDVAGLRQNVLDEIKQVKWIPAWGQPRIENMVSGRPDWCISRQRTWGVPIPVFTNKETGELHPQTLEIIEKVAKLVEKDGIQAWWDVSNEELLGAEDANKYTKAKDTLDVWFDSGATSQTVVKLRPEYKGNITNMYLEGSDQHRGWFMSSICIGAGVTQKAPYKEVLTHGFIVDGNGQKMSKSLGNVIVPQEVNEKYGADILRLWVAQTDYTSDIRVSDEILKRSVDQYRRIRNTTRFLLANLNGFDPEKHAVPFEQMLSVDRYIVSLAKAYQEQVRANYEKYELHLIVKTLMQFCSVDLGSFYLDTVKDRIYTLKEDSLARRSAQTAMYYVAEALVRWMAPILSFTAQEAWEHLPGNRDKYVFTAYHFDKLVANDTAVSDNAWKELLQVRDQANVALEALRKDKTIGSSLEAQVTLYVSPEAKELVQALNTLGEEAKYVFLVSKLEVKDLSQAPVKADKFYVEAAKVDAPKCDRCWHFTSSVGSNANHPQLCARCVDNLEGEGEVRHFA